MFVDFESNFIQSIWNKVQNLWVSEDQAVELTGEWEDQKEIKNSKIVFSCDRV